MSFALETENFSEKIPPHWPLIDLEKVGSKAQKAGSNGEIFDKTFRKKLRKFLKIELLD